MEPIKTILYRGYNIKIYQDEVYNSPDDWGDEECFLVAYHKDFTVTRDNIITRDEAVDIARGDAKPLKGYWMFGLEAYIHSGVVLALSHTGNFPYRQWDVSQLGFVLVKRQKGLNEARAREKARHLITVWNQALSGEVYGYIIHDKNGKHLDSRWGYYGDYNKDLLIDAKNWIDYYIKYMREKHLKKLKIYIKESVPLDRRLVNEFA